MNLKRLMIIAAATCAAAAAVSCKKDKDDDTVTRDSFSGSLEVQGVLPFVLKGDTIDAVPAGLGNEGVDIGYYWTASPLMTDRDTVRHIGDPETNKGEFSLKVKDTLCTVTVTCTAFADGYYTKSASAYCTIVDPAFGGTLTGDGVDAEFPSVKDARDGQTYYYKTIGKLDWFVRNLAYAESGVPFRRSAAMDGIFGRYYTWKAAQDACPAGWRVPSPEDWKALATEAGYSGETSSVYAGIAGNLMADAYFNGEKMWEYWPAVKITNRTGFTSIPTGYGILTSNGATFYAGFEDAVYWTSASQDGDLGLNMMINVNKPDLVGNAVSDDSFLASVRCVRDSAE